MIEPNKTSTSRSDQSFQDLGRSFRRVISCIAMAFDDWAHNDRWRRNTFVRRRNLKHRSDLVHFFASSGFSNILSYLFLFSVLLFNCCKRDILRFRTTTLLRGPPPRSPISPFFVRALPPSSHL